MVSDIHSKVSGCMPDYARIALDILDEAGKQAFLVGGFVRDAIMGRPANDVDITTDALWYKTRDIFIERGFRVVESGAAHGTVTVIIEGQPVEITTFRTDGTYSDHRRPDSVRFVNNVEDDLARRDFTINALAWSPSAGLVDPFGGLSDISMRCIRAVGDPDKRFDEDALRVLRGVRFQAQLGFAIDELTSRAIHSHAADLSTISVERIASEYDKLVRGAFAVETLRAYPDVAAQAIPGIASMVGFDQRSRWHRYDVWEHCLHALESLPSDAKPIVRHVTLLHDIGKPGTFTMGQDGNGHFYGHEETGAKLIRESFARLKWSASDVSIMEYLVRQHDRPIDPSDRGVRRFLAKTSRLVGGDPERSIEVFEHLLMLKKADTLSHAEVAVEKRMREILRVEETFARIRKNRDVFCLRDMAVDGADLIDLGMKPGPLVGETLRSLLADVIDGRLANEKDVLLASVQGIVSPKSGDCVDCQNS